LVPALLSYFGGLALTAHPESLKDEPNMSNPASLPVPEFLIRVIAELTLIRELSIDELFDEIGYRPGRQLTVGDIDKGVEWIIQRSGQPWAALEFGTQINIQQMGKLGPLIASCGTVGDALHLFHRYHLLVHPFSNMEFERVGSRHAMRMTDYPGMVAPRWRAEVLLGGLPYWIERFVGRKFALHEVWFRHPAPEYADRYYSHFSCKVSFNQAMDCLWTDGALLNLKIKTYSPAYHTAVLIEAEAELKDLISFSHRAKEAIRANLSDDPGIEEIAALLLCSKRTLQRKLADEGASVKQLKQEARCDEASALLEKTSLSIDQIAYKLGYEQRSNFSTAFQRWTGFTPQEWRAKAKGKP
jgi:AraC-like DNA-binding protein